MSGWIFIPFSVSGLGRICTARGGANTGDGDGSGIHCQHSRLALRNFNDQNIHRAKRLRSTYTHYYSLHDISAPVDAQSVEIMVRESSMVWQFLAAVSLEHTSVVRICPRVIHRWWGIPVSFLISLEAPRSVSFLSLDRRGHMTIHTDQSHYGSQT